MVIVLALHITGPGQAQLLAGGSLLVLLAAMSEGPLGAWAVIRRSSHRGADRAVVLVLALLPALPGRSLVSALVLEGLAVALWRLSAQTSFASTRRRHWARRVGLVASLLAQQKARGRGQDVPGS